MTEALNVRRHRTRCGMLRSLQRFESLKEASVLHCKFNYDKP
jgi:hypothetical protein